MIDQFRPKSQQSQNSKGKIKSIVALVLSFRHRMQLMNKQHSIVKDFSNLIRHSQHQYQHPNGLSKACYQSSLTRQFLKLMKPSHRINFCNNSRCNSWPSINTFCYFNSNVRVFLDPQNLFTRFKGKKVQRTSAINLASRILRRNPKLKISPASTSTGFHHT